MLPTPRPDAPTLTSPPVLADVPGTSAGAAFCVLVFDTSTERLAVALHARGRPWLLNSVGGAAASAVLLPHVAALLARAGCSRSDITHIAFGRGPGAFTGLRTACAVAQGLGLGLDRPVIALDSLLLVAEDARAQAAAGDGFEVGVLMDARMDEVYAARYRWYAAGQATAHGAGWQVLQAPALYSLPVLQQGWQAFETATALAGTALAAFGDRLPPLPTAAAFPVEQDRAAAALRLAVAAAQAGEGGDAALALPLYLRDKVALTTREREAVRDAKLASAATSVAADNAAASASASAPADADR